MICTKIVLSFILLGFWLVSYISVIKGIGILFYLCIYYTTKLVICQVVLIKKYSILLY